MLTLPSSLYYFSLIPYIVFSLFRKTSRHSNFEVSHSLMLKIGVNQKEMYLKPMEMVQALPIIWPIENLNQKQTTRYFRRITKNGNSSKTHDRFFQPKKQLLFQEACQSWPQTKFWQTSLFANLNLLHLRVFSIFAHSLPFGWNECEINN